MIRLVSHFHQLTEPTRPGYRRRLAEGLRLRVATATGPRRQPRLQMPLRRSEIRENRELLLQLARDLERADEVRPRGLILASRLVTDASSPLYVNGREGLEVEVRQARAALHLY
jgi:hypothetical protein